MEVCGIVRIEKDHQTYSILHVEKYSRVETGADIGGAVSLVTRARVAYGTRNSCVASLLRVRTREQTNEHMREYSIVHV